MKIIIYLLIFFGYLKLYSQNNIPTDLLVQKEKIGINNQNFKINGFYYSKHIRIKSKTDTVKYIHPIIFFENGMVVPFDFIGNSSNTLKRKGNGKKCKLKPRQDFNTIINFFRCYTEIVDKKKVFTVYSINSNMIRWQSITPKVFVEGRGVILNDTTFIYNQSLNYITKEFENKSQIYHFKASKKPDSTKLKPASEIKKYFFK